jgi:cathepsin X
VSTIADRIKILTKGQQRDVIPSIQVLLNCGTAGSCGGGDIHAAMRWIHMNSIPDVTCQAYTATDGNCTAMSTCMTCDPTNGCYPVTSYPKITISEYGRVIGDENIQREILNRGPVACYLNAE